MPEPEEQQLAADAADPADAADAAVSEDVGGEGAEADGPHHDDGLDLARSITAATASSGLIAPRRRPRRPRPTTARVSGSHPDERDPRLLDAEVARLVGERGWGLPLRVQGVFVRWAEIVGAEVADHARPETFADGRLAVRTDSTAWATQLRLLAPDLVRRLNDVLGPGTVTVLDVAGPQAPSWRRGPRSVRDGRGPRDTYG